MDYLGLASKYAQDGDLDAAYNALMRRGFKMAETGSTGGGTSQDQAYALIHQLYSQSPGAQQTYQNKLSANQQALQDHQTQFGLEARPALAYKQFLSSDGRYWITYDGQGRPAVANPVSSKLGASRPNYSDDEIDLLSQYYSGTGDREDLAELERQLHNLAVVRTGNGRLVDQAGNWASGQGQVPVSAKDWTGLPENNRNQDTAALQALLEQINAGQVSRTPVVVPSGQNQGGNTGLPTGVAPGLGNGGSTDLDLPGGSWQSPGASGNGVSGAMNDYLDQWLQNAQQQQQNTIDYGTNQAVLELLRNKQDADASFQEQRNQLAIDEARAKDNQALYAEARGDKGGIGAAQYDTVMNTAAQNRLAVNSAQTKLATDTSRQISDLRAQGEYEKADALLTLSQQYLSQLMSLEQWAADYNLSLAQFNASLQQWEKEYDLKVADLLGSYQGQPTMSAKQFAFNQQQYADSLKADQRDFEFNLRKYEDSLKSDQEAKLANTGQIFLNAGILPSASQLAAMGMTEEEALGYITAKKVADAAKSKNKGSSGGGGGNTSEKEMKLTAAEKMADEGQFTDEVLNTLRNAGYNDEYIMSKYGWDPYGSKYDYAVQVIRSMINSDMSNEQIKNRLNQFTPEELTEAGMDAILSHYNFEGYNNGR